MKLKGIRDEDFTNYKKPSMYLAFPTCTFKCERECGQKMCQNSTLAITPDIAVDIDGLIQRYLSNPITSSITCGGLEPLDSWDDLYEFIYNFRLKSNDDIVIYTGFYAHEVEDKLAQLQKFTNIVIKFGRFIPGQQPHYDEVLGIMLASDNQYAERIS